MQIGEYEILGVKETSLAQMTTMLDQLAADQIWVSFSYARVSSQRLVHT